MLRGLFVTGTDTNVGKTVATAGLLHRYRAGVRLRYWKPVQTGIEQDDDTAEIRRLTGCDETNVLPWGIRLAAPVSPHLAARLAGITIDLDTLTAPIFSQAAPDRWLVEGAGGALVPLSDGTLITDLMACLGLPVVVVARTSLGTINHTLLTLEALRTRSLRVAGVVLVGDRQADTRTAIEHYGLVRVVGEIPRFPRLTADELARWACANLDPSAELWEFLR